MKHLTMTLVISLFFSVQAISQTTESVQGLPSAEQVLAKYIQATGGSAAHRKLTSGVANGEGQNVTRGIRLATENYSKAPDMRVEILDDPNNRGFTGRGYDGTDAWSMNLMETGLRHIHGAELAMAQRENDFYRAIRLDSLYQKLVVSGEDSIDVRPVVVLTAIPGNGNPEKLYFDIESGLLLRRDLAYGTTPVQHYYEDYREVDGIMLPFVLRSEGPVRLITRFSEIKHNVPVDDGKFNAPG